MLLVLKQNLLKVFQWIFQHWLLLKNVNEPNTKRLKFKQSNQVTA